MRIPYLLLLLGLCAPLAACQTTAEREAALNAKDNETCESYGAKFGTDAYVKCRTDLQRNRAIEDASARQALDESWGVGPDDPFFCHRTPFGPRCF